MIAETISLGILSLPVALAKVGIIPGMMLILGLGIVATYTGYVLGQFKMRHSHVHSMADAGEILCGSLGREFFGAAQILLLIFIMASHVLTFSIMMNTLTGHATCSITFGFIGMIVCYICTLPRKLGDVSWMAIASFISIVAAVTITMIGVGVKRPAHGVIQTTVQSDFAKGFLSATNIIFAYVGHVTFFSFISELKDPKTYSKALYLLQFADTSMYLLVATIIYAYGGEDVRSPALGSTTLLLQKIAYSVAS